MDDLSPRQLADAIRSTQAHKYLVEILKRELALQRETYEDKRADEFERGRVVQLKDLLTLLG